MTTESNYTSPSILIAFYAKESDWYSQRIVNSGPHGGFKLMPFLAWQTN